MKIFFGFLIGVVIAALIALTAIKVAWGDMTDLEDRDRASDVSKTIEAADFDRISIAGVIELDVNVGPEFSVALSGREEDLAITEAHVVDGVLVLETGKKIEGEKRRFNRHSVTAKITMPALNGIDVAGVVDGGARGIAADHFKADISGVGDLELAGTCNVFDADVSGVGDLDASDFKCRDVKIDVSGVGGASVYASQSVDAEIAGIGKVEISGSPANVSKSNSGPFGRITVN